MAATRQGKENDNCSRKTTFTRLSLDVEAVRATDRAVMIWCPRHLRELSPFFARAKKRKISLNIVTLHLYGETYKVSFFWINQVNFVWKIGSSCQLRKAQADFCVLLLKASWQLALRKRARYSPAVTFLITGYGFSWRYTWKIPALVEQKKSANLEFQKQDFSWFLISKSECHSQDVQWSLSEAKIDTNWPNTYKSFQFNVSLCSILFYCKQWSRSSKRLGTILLVHALTLPHISLHMYIWAAHAGLKTSTVVIMRVWNLFRKKTKQKKNNTAWCSEMDPLTSMDDRQKTNYTAPGCIIGSAEALPILCVSDFCE